MCLHHATHALALGGARAIMGLANVNCVLDFLPLPRAP